MSLEQIIMIQQDEPNQKSCIYKLSAADNKESSSRPVPAKKRRFTQVRVKTINFKDEQAHAIFLYDMTHHVESLKLETELVKQQERHEVIDM